MSKDTIVRDEGVAGSNPATPTSFPAKSDRSPDSFPDSFEGCGTAIKREAVLSDCGRYRYLLLREWAPGMPRALFVMLNPSTADAEVDDATIRSCIRLTRVLGYGSFEVVNLFAWRATDPAELMKSPDAIGPGNEAAFERASFRCKDVICAWGAHPMARYRIRRVTELLRLHHSALHCFGKTKDGAPKHPLYIKSGTPLQKFGA